MQKLLVPVLVLVTVAVSSSNLLPILSMTELNTDSLNFDYPQNENTYSNIHQSRNNPDAILFNVDVEPNFENLSQDPENNDDYSSVNKDINYNAKGFRQEQWHNYPRQLDRLNRYIYEHSTDKRNLDPDDPDESVGRLERSLGDITPNEFHVENEIESSKITNDADVADADVAAAVMNPLLILRIRLACYNKNQGVDSSPQIETIDLENDKIQETNKRESSFSNGLNPESNLIKVKRQDKINFEDNETHKNSSENRTVNKRIFSLWSRLQSLNPKGHQLHHRRHMYALYGPPDTEGGGPPPGVLTAETRATFMRPPGSPLRWG